MDALGTKMTTVPYKGTGPAMTDLLGGQVDLMCDQTTNTDGPDQERQDQGLRGHHQGAAVLAARPADPRRGGPARLRVSVWHGLYAPKGTPKEAVDKLAAALQAALKDPKVIERFADLGTEPVPQEQATPAALEQHLQAEIAKWKPVIQKAGDYAD